MEVGQALSGGVADLAVVAESGADFIFQFGVGVRVLEEVIGDGCHEGGGGLAAGDTVESKSLNRFELEGKGRGRITDGEGAYTRVETWAVISSFSTSPLLTFLTRVVRKSFREDWVSRRLCML